MVCFSFGMGKMIKVRGSQEGFQAFFYGEHTELPGPHFFGQWLEGLGGIPSGYVKIAIENGHL